MVDRGKGGVIVNLASLAGFSAYGPGFAHYTPSKHGVVGLTKSLAVELGPFNIRVLAVAPTLTDTPGLEEGLELVPLTVVQEVHHEGEFVFVITDRSVLALGPGPAACI